MTRIMVSNIFEIVYSLIIALIPSNLNDFVRFHKSLITFPLVLPLMKASQTELNPFGWL